MDSGIRFFTARFFREEQGQAVIEYLFILSLIVLFSTLLVRAINEGIDRAILAFGGKLESALKTGRAPPSVYRN